MYFKYVFLYDSGLAQSKGAHIDVAFFCVHFFSHNVLWPDPIFMKQCLFPLFQKVYPYWATSGKVKPLHK